MISSDTIRAELYGDESCQDNPALVFKQMQERAVAHLQAGNNVYYDATNINAKKRKHTLSEIKRQTEDVECIAIYFATSLGECIERDLSRPRTVGVDVIMKMYKSLQIPQEREGFDKILIRNAPWDDYLFFHGKYENYLSLLRNFNECHPCIKFEQHNPYHSLTVSEHMYEAFSYAVKQDYDWRVRIAAALHDIGKPVCQEFNGEYARYFGHEYTSAQLAIRVLSQVDIKVHDMLYIVDLIQNHMKAHQIANATEKAKKKFEEELGKEKYTHLMQLHDCDMSTK